MARLKMQVLDSSGLRHMKERTEQLLAERGVTIKHPALCQALADKGCQVDGEQVRFPRAVIAQAVAAVPESFTLCAPDERYDLPFPRPDGGFYTRTNTGAPLYLTAEGALHPYTLEDAAEWFRVCNAMEHIDFVALPSTSSDSIQTEAVDVRMLEQALLVSQKHIWIQPYESDNVSHLIAVAQAAAGGAEALRRRPIVSFISCSVPLLHFKHMDAEVIYRCAQPASRCSPARCRPPAPIRR